MTEDKKVSAHRRHDHESEGTGIRLCTGRKRNDYSISQPALSIYINNLEKSLGVRLFERVGKQFILTYAGEQYVEKAKLILQLSHELDEKLKDITGNYSGRIRIGVQPGDRIFAPCYCLLRKGISRSGSDPL